MTRKIFVQQSLVSVYWFKMERRNRLRPIDRSSLKVNSHSDFPRRTISLSESSSNGIVDQRKSTQTKFDENVQSTILLDTSDDYCAVCRCGGELVCCDECPRVYHIECHVPSLNEISMNDKWKCGLCSEINHLLKRKQDDGIEQLSATEKQICEKLVLQMYTHPSSVPFHNPVPADVRFERSLRRYILLCCSVLVTIRSLLDRWIFERLRRKLIPMRILMNF